MSNYKDNYYGSILDPLHGDIKLSEIEKWIISQPIFSRLRNVRQNTFLYYVFPSANHTRFEHSIGVMHIASKIFESCKENFATGIKKKEKYKKDITSLFHDLNKLKEREELYFQELRLAALMHDIGHGPLSHLFDKFAISKDVFLEIVSKDSDLLKYKKQFQTLIEKENNKVEHEIISCLFIMKLIKLLKDENTEEKFSKSTNELIKKISAERIVNLLEPEFEFNDDKYLDEEGNDYSQFFSRIITSFPIDSDRMDYLLRDSYFSGVTYGIYDINRVFASFLPVCQNNKVELTFKENGLDSVLRFIQSRTHLFNQVYFHKTNRAANTMLAYGTTSKKVKLLDNCKDADEIVTFYIKNTDEYFLRKTVKKQIADTHIEKRVIGDLIARKLFKRVYQHKIVLSKLNFPDKENLESQKEQIKIIKEQISVKLNELAKQRVIFAAVDLYENDTFKDATKKVLIAKKDNESYTFDSEWESYNSEFKLSSMIVVMIRIYLSRPFKNSKDFEDKRREVLSVIDGELESLKKISC